MAVKMQPGGWGAKGQLVKLLLEWVRKVGNQRSHTTVKAEVYQILDVPHLNLHRRQDSRLKS